MSRSITASEIAQHAAPNDFWLVLGGEVYEFKDWTHPGGWYRIEPYAGKTTDALNAFEGAHGSLYIQTYEANEVRNRKIGVFEGSATNQNSGSTTTAGTSYPAEAGDSSDSDGEEAEGPEENDGDEMQEGREYQMQSGSSEGQKYQGTIDPATIKFKQSSDNSTV